jgi:hypothetical protein
MPITPHPAKAPFNDPRSRHEQPNPLLRVRRLIMISGSSVALAGGLVLLNCLSNSSAAHQPTQQAMGLPFDSSQSYQADRLAVPAPTPKQQTIYAEPPRQATLDTIAARIQATSIRGLRLQEAEVDPTPTLEAVSDEEMPDPSNCYTEHAFADKMHQNAETRQLFAEKENEKAKAHGVRIHTWGAGNQYLEFIALRDGEAYLRAISVRLSQPDSLAGFCVSGFSQVQFTVMDDSTHSETIIRLSTNAYKSLRYFKSLP